MLRQINPGDGRCRFSISWQVARPGPNQVSKFAEAPLLEEADSNRRFRDALAPPTTLPWRDAA